MCSTTELVEKNYRKWLDNQKNQKNQTAGPPTTSAEPAPKPELVVEKDVLKSIFFGISVAIFYALLLTISIALLVKLAVDFHIKSFVLWGVLGAGFLTGTKFGFFVLRGSKDSDLLGGIIFGFIGMLVAVVSSLSICLFLVYCAPHKVISVQCFIIIAISMIVPTLLLGNAGLIRLYSSNLRKSISPLHLICSFAISFFGGLVVFLFCAFQFVIGWK